MALQFLDEDLELLFAAEFGIEARRIGDIVAVGAAAAGLEDGGGVDVSDAELAQVGDQGLRIRETESPVELEAVGGDGNPQASHLLHVDQQPVAQRDEVTEPFLGGFVALLCSPLELAIDGLEHVVVHVLGFPEAYLEGQEARQADHRF